MAQAIEVTATYRDQANKTATNTMFVNAGLTIAQYIARLQQAAVIIDAATQAILEGIEFCVSVDISGLTLNTVNLISDVEEVAAWQFLTDEGRPVNLNIPGGLTALTAEGSDDLDLLNSVNGEIQLMMLNGLEVTGSVVIEPCDVDEGDITTLVYAREEVRNSGTRR